MVDITLILILSMPVIYFFGKFLKGLLCSSCRREDGEILPRYMI